MISNPVLLSLSLLSLVGLILWAERSGRAVKLFNFLPVPFWCYFLPMVLATLGFFPEQSPVYRFLSSYGLAACLILLLLGVDVPSLLRVGPTALGALAAGALGMVLGATGSYAVFAQWLPQDMWMGVGALSASWVGGSANMVAVKESLGAPETVFAPMVIVDTIMAYSWLALLVALAAWQKRWDTWVGADPTTLEKAVIEVEGQVSTTTTTSTTTSFFPAFFLIPVALALGALCIYVAPYFPTAGASLTQTTWAFLLATFVGIGLSFSPAKQLERFGASRWGYFCLYLLLASIGAKARLNAILETPLVLGMAMLWVAIHAGTLTLYGLWKKLPLFFLATASQACIGGVASTPIVAGVYQPRLAPLGLLLAISANVVGTYVGLFVAEICRYIR